jgi:hypothetical protein
MSGMIAILSKEVRFWTPVKKILKTLTNDELQILEKKVKALDNSPIQLNLLLFLWKKKKNCESMLKTLFSAKNCQENMISNALNSFPEEDYAFKGYLSF